MKKEKFNPNRTVINEAVDKFLKQGGTIIKLKNTDKTELLNIMFHRTLIRETVNKSFSY